MFCGTDQLKSTVYRLADPAKKQQKLELEEAFDKVLTRLPKFKNSYLRGDFEKELVRGDEEIGGKAAGTKLIAYLIKIVSSSVYVSVW